MTEGSIKSNNELYEMNQAIRESMLQLGYDLRETQLRLKEYNGLRETIAQLQLRGCQRPEDWDKVHESIKDLSEFMHEYKKVEEHKNRVSEKALRVIAVVTSVSSFVLAMVLAFLKMG